MPPAARGERGQVLASVLAVVSLVVVVGAAAGLVFTGTAGTPDVAAGAELATRAAPQRTPDIAHGDRAGGPGKHQGKHKQPAKKPRRPGGTPTKRPGPVPDAYVEVYNNTGVSGLAAATADRLEARGWDVVGIANWYGEIEATAVYAPPQLRAEARRLARVLGVGRTAPAVPPMDSDKLTVILTSDFAD